MESDLVPLRRALLSVSDKTGLLDLAQGLAERGVELLSTGGTAKALRDAGLPVRDVAADTDFPEMLDGRVKTLHPMVHAGLLARRDDAGHRASLEEFGIGTIDLLVVNLYPFCATPGREPTQVIDDQRVVIVDPVLIEVVWAGQLAIEEDGTLLGLAHLLPGSAQQQRAA
jgi:phosphoribosylaminoimidazolecarboxamide formyltransferase/IMP cyclohydrolase